MVFVSLSSCKNAVICDIYNGWRLKFLSKETIYFTGKSLWEIVTGAETVSNEASERQKKKKKLLQLTWNLCPFCWNCKLTEAVGRMCSVKKGFLKNYQNSQQNTCTRILKNTFVYRQPSVAASE